MTSTAWLLNLDADIELRRPDKDTPPKAKARIAELATQMAPLWLPGDVVIVDDAPRLDGLTGRAWCPTPRAQSRLSLLGATLHPAPPFEVLRRVNHRGFSADIGQTLPNATWASDLDALERCIAQPAPLGWLMKRPFSFAGTGQRRVHAGRLADGDRGWAIASLRDDGLQIEPIVDIAVELSLHGFVAPSSAVTLGEPCRQHTGPGGVWLSSERYHREVSRAERRALQDEALRVATALHAAGYFGPFGIDAYIHGRERALNPRSEINARYTMGWALGMTERPDLA